MVVPVMNIRPVRVGVYFSLVSVAMVMCRLRPHIGMYMVVMSVCVVVIVFVLLGFVGMWMEVLIPEKDNQ